MDCVNYASSTELLLRRGGVAHRVAGLLDRAVDLAAGHLGPTILAAGEGEPEEQGGAYDAENGIGMSHDRRLRAAMQQHVACGLVLSRHVSCCRSLATSAAAAAPRKLFQC